MQGYKYTFLFCIVLQVVIPSCLASSSCVPISDLQFKSINGRLEANNGIEIKLKGANWWGFETNDQSVGGLYTTSMAAVLDFLKANNFNALRVPYSSDLSLNPNTRMPNVNTWANPTLSGKNSMQVMDQLFDMCAQRGIVILLDNHRFDPSQWDSTPLWYSTTCINNRDNKCVNYTEDSLKTSLGNMVQRYKSKWNFLAVDIVNEPHGDEATWGTGNVAGDWNLAVERIGNHLISTYPDWQGLIFAEGNSDTYNCELSHGGHWWGGNLEGVRCAPIQLSQPERLVYSPHVYGPSVYEQPYFSSPDMPNNLAPIYQQHFGFVANMTGRAVVIGEWGGPYTGTDKVVQDAQAAFFKASNISSTFYWAVNPNPGGDTDGLLMDDWKTPNAPKLAFLADAHPDPTKFTQNGQYMCFNGATPDGMPTQPTTKAPTPAAPTPTPTKAATPTPKITTPTPKITTPTPTRTSTTRAPTPTSTSSDSSTTVAPTPTRTGPTITSVPTTVVPTTLPPGSESGKHTTSAVPVTPVIEKTPYAGTLNFDGLDYEFAADSSASVLALPSLFIVLAVVMVLF